MHVKVAAHAADWFQLLHSCGFSPSFFYFDALERVTAAATAAHYGSVSVVTFAAGSEYLRTLGVEIMSDGALGVRRAFLAAPLQALRAGANGGERAAEDADPAAIGGKRPAEGLPAVHLLGERASGNILGEPQRPPRCPLRRGHRA